eukprot:TRINITY_DN4499_c1_g1_i1.p1 TRINITY_DN4499_c1_g1~~TRINITY_DN4499_c1_g1_i1.p1  ORF type:complete len:236 (+),score=55.27 TRINITY_DN4499_c1_g1_i1:1231-1938(+)
MFKIMEEESTKGLWEKLEKLYMGKNLTNKLHLKKQLYGLKMEEGCDLMEHMNTFNRMISDLLRLDVKFDEEDRSLLLLNSLSDPYEHFVTTLLYGKETLNFEEVTQDIISNADRRKPSKGDTHAEGLLVKEGSHNHGRSKDRGRSRRNNSRSKSKSKKDSECLHCGKKRHWKKDCRHYKASKDGKNKAGDKSESSDPASVASEKEVDSNLSRKEMIVEVRHFLLHSLKCVVAIPG